MKKNYILFITGSYKKRDLPFYKSLIKNKVKIAVDGGYSFFRMAKSSPDYIIGDLDSVTLPKYLLASEKVISFPKRKNKTDSQLAVEYCIEQKAHTIEMVMPSVGEIDHFTGNLMLANNRKLSKWVKEGGLFRILNPYYELILLIDNKFKFSDSKDDLLSVIPISGKIKLTTSGMEYNVSDVTITSGETQSLRNRIILTRAEVEVVGKALIYHKFKRQRVK